MPAFVIYNANAREVIEAKTLQEAMDKFIELHPSEIYNAMTIKSLT